MNVTKNSGSNAINEELKSATADNMVLAKTFVGTSVMIATCIAGMTGLLTALGSTVN
ncbi:hypothetical protein [Enterovibrio nigricans]|uniref:hypothetical protein n=1 Tax=Enterovibrio nigricans TaxID=504469 RepID=UPI0012FF1F0C|nr:hypothetical protein [Enterovibrio nigricans]